MSASQTENAAKAVADRQGEFGSHIAPTGAQEKGGHQPGRLVTEADKAPDSTIATLPPGSAPASKTYTPNPDPDIHPGQPDADAAPAAEDTMHGSTSADVHTGLGHPGAGTSSQEEHDGSKQAGGLQGVGASGAASHTQFGSERVDMSTSVPGATQKAGSEARGRGDDYRMHDETG